MAALLKKNGITPIFFTICPINLTINPAFRETNAYIRENHEKTLALYDAYCEEAEKRGFWVK